MIERAIKAGAIATIGRRRAPQQERSIGLAGTHMLQDGLIAGRWGMVRLVDDDQTEVAGSCARRTGAGKGLHEPTMTCASVSFCAALTTPINRSGATRRTLSTAWVMSSSRWASTRARTSRRRMSSAKQMVFPLPVGKTRSWRRMP